MKKTLILFLLHATVYCVPLVAFSQCANLSFEDGQPDCRVNLGNLNTILSGKPGEYTFEAWIKIKQDLTPGSFQWIFGDEKNFNGGIHIGLYENHISTFSPATSYVISKYRISANTWTHIAFVQDNSILKLYVNGAFIQILLSYPNLHRETNDESYLGQFTDNIHGFWRNFKGNMDEVQLWNYARSEGDLNKYSTQKNVSEERGLAAFYTMDDTGTLELTDYSGHGNNGKITGAVQKENGNAISYPPVNLKAESITSTSAFLHWKQILCFKDNILKYKKTNEDKWNEQKVDAGKDSVSLYRLSPSTEYTWLISDSISLETTGMNPGTITQKFTTADVYHKNGAKRKIRQPVIVPNLVPRSQPWKILSSEAINSVSLINVTGVVVFRISDYHNSIMLSNLKNGIYFYQVAVKSKEGVTELHKGKLMLTD